MADISNLSLQAFKKGQDNPVATGDKGARKVAITGLTPGTVVGDGQYEAAFTDGTTLSDKVDVPGWTVAQDTDKPTTGDDSTSVVGKAVVGTAKI